MLGEVIRTTNTDADAAAHDATGLVAHFSMMCMFNEQQRLSAEQLSTLQTSARRIENVFHSCRNEESLSRRKKSTKEKSPKKSWRDSESMQA